jgi:hypothetical protein
MPALDDERQAKRARQESDEDADLLWEKGENLPSPNRDDGFFKLLQAADYPTGDPDDDLTQGEVYLLPRLDVAQRQFDV